MGWDLIIDEVEVGQLYLDYIDQPFFFCGFSPTPEFDVFASLFAEEIELFEATPRDEDAWEEAFERIQNLDLRLVSGSEQITELILHIQGDTAWFRY